MGEFRIFASFVLWQNWFFSEYKFWLISTSKMSIACLFGAVHLFFVTPAESLPHRSL